MGPLVINGVIITDCNDGGCGSAEGRLATRWRRLYGFTPTIIGIEVHTSELEEGSRQAVMHLLDQIDASRTPELDAGDPGFTLILVNSATRGETPLHRPNGSPFCWWWADAYTLVVSTLDGPVLPEANRLGVIPSGTVQVIDMPEVLHHAVNEGWISRFEADRISVTQFRSYEFQPLVAKWILLGRSIPSTPHVVSDATLEDVTVLYADGFGNLTLSVTAEQFGYREGDIVTLANDEYALCVSHLKDVPKGPPDEPVLALTIGSNGLRNPKTSLDNRFLELVVMQDSAAKITGYRPGDTVVLAKHIPANQEVSR